MDRINHVKIISPDPQAVDQFLREVVDIPEGWPLGPMSPPPQAGYPMAGDADGALTIESVFEFRGPFEGGLITGSPESRQFQILQGASPAIWSVAIGTRHLERARERCEARGYPLHRYRRHGVEDRHYPVLLRRGGWHRVRGDALRGRGDDDLDRA